MTRHLFILTGGSRGMGAAIAEQLLQPGHTLLCISRGTNAGLEATAAKTGAMLMQWTADLADPAPVAQRLEAWLDGEPADAFDTASLINNAAALTALVPLEENGADELVRALRVGLEAPMLLSSVFLRATKGWRARRDGQCKLLNISSGLGRHAMASQAPYCAVKAGLDHFSRASALDQAAAPHPARVVSLAPGVIDTDMQSQIRAADPSRFPDHARFTGMKEQGKLDSPATAAAKVIGYLNRADFGTNPIADVRDA